MRITMAILVAPLLASLASPTQELRNEDVPSTAPGPDVYQSLPLEPTQRADLEKAVAARNYDRAETLLADAITGNPKSTSLLTAVGSIFFLDGRYLECAIALKKAEKIAPLDDHHRLTLALAYIILDHRDWARPELEKLATNDPHDAVYPYWQGRLDYDAMQFNQAVARFQKALDLNPHFMKAYDNLGLCYEALAQYDDAIRTYQEAVRLNNEMPNPSPWPPLNLGTLLVKLEKLGDARTALQESLRYDSRFPKAHFQLGLLLEKEKNDNGAIEELQLAIKYDPSYPDPYYVLGRIYQRRGDKRRAEEALNIFQALKKEKPDARPH
jgi:tetratricopeptide (TPR) repeat protein